MKIMTSFAVSLLIVASLATACDGIKFPPVLTAIEQSVLNDLNAGDTEAQIDTDVCKDLGGSTLTDAVCVDVTELVENIVGVLLETNVLTTTGKTTGVTIRSGHVAK